MLKTTRLLLLMALFAAQAFAQGQPARQQPASLPQSLTNAQFWGLISEFSESGGTFPSDNFTSNELAIGQVATDLIARGRTGGAYLGVGPEQNFTYIAATKPEIVFIVDIRRQAVMQHLMYKAIFEMSQNRSEFISRLFSRPLQPTAVPDTSIREIWLRYVSVQADSALYRANVAAIHEHLTKTRALPISSADSLTIAQVYSVFYRFGPAINYSSRVGAVPPPTVSATAQNFLSLTSITDTLGIPRSFLASEENFHVIRNLHMKNLFIPVVGNFGGPQALRKVGDYLRDHHTFLNAYYVSNVEQYLFRPPVAGPPLWNEYYTSVGFMPLDSTSVFIRPNGLRVTPAQVLQQVAGLQLTSNNPAPYAASARYVSTPPPPLPPPPPAPVVQQANLGSVVGTVTDSATGNALGSASVTIPGTSAGATTNVNGQYVIPNVAPGLYTVTARRVGYGTAIAADVRVAAGVPTTVDLKPGAQTIVLSGVVSTGVAGAPFSVSLGASSAGPVLCPVVPFLAAYTAGRVLSYNDATRCVQ